MTDALLDADARQRIATSHAETLFVEAGAGSGKTSSLVSRVVNLVVAGTDVAEIAAITFTEAAAAELRARVRQTLEDVEVGRPVRYVTDTPDARRLAATALDRLDRATICTLHAFAQGLLLGAPVEAGLPPRIDVHDDISSALRFEDRWQRFERRLLDDDELEPVMRTALTLGLTSENLQAVAAMLGQNWDLVEEADADGLVAADRHTGVDFGTLDATGWLQTLDHLAQLATECTDPDDTLLAWVDDVAVPLRARVDACRDDPYLLLTIAGTSDRHPKPGNKGRKASWPHGHKQAILAAWASVRDAMAEAAAAISHQVLTRLGAELATYTLADAEARRREGQLEFHDLLVLARRLVRTRRDIRERFHLRYPHLLIDEFQDTDPIQVELAVRIAADPDHDPRQPWDEVPIEPGRLFFVGDPKQSIYRFRRADIDLFSRTAARYRTGHTSLHVNFRSVAPVLEFCNAVFERMIRREVERAGPDLGLDRIAQPDYVPLAQSRPALDGDPGPPVLLLGDGTPHASAGAARDAEAADVAGALRRAHDEGWQVAPDGDPRPCRWSDMAVLLPSRTTLSHLRSNLDALDIPYRLESGTLVYGTTEVTDLVAILRAIDDPGDRVAVAGALRSPAYGCGDDDLFSWVQAGNELTYLDPTAVAPSSAPSEGPVAEGLADLRRRHRAAPFSSIPELVDVVIRERRLMELSLAGGRHRDVWRLYRVVLEHARQFADGEAGGLRSFLHWVDLQRDDKLRATSPVIPEADVDAVRILTVHGSKGLEFGITAVSGLSAEDPNAVTNATVQFRPTGGFDVRMRRGMETARYESVRTLEESMDGHERIRLLYVGLTRARDHLIVSSHHTERGREKSHGGRLSAHLDDIEAETGVGLAERWTLVEVGDPEEAVASERAAPVVPAPGVPATTGPAVTGPATTGPTTGPTTGHGDRREPDAPIGQLAFDLDGRAPDRLDPAVAPADVDMGGPNRRLGATTCPDDRDRSVGRRDLGHQGRPAPGRGGTGCRHGRARRRDDGRPARGRAVAARAGRHGHRAGRARRAATHRPARRHRGRCRPPRSLAGRGRGHPE